MNTKHPGLRFSKERLEEVFSHLDSEEIKCYCYLQNTTIDDKDYRAKFMIYYRMIIESKKHEWNFFSTIKKMQKKKGSQENIEIDFVDILKMLHRKARTPLRSNPPLFLDSAFLCSVLMHTINPCLPVWDDNTINYFRIILPQKSNLSDYTNAYEELIDKVNNEIDEDPNSWFKTWRNLFRKNDVFSKFNLTDIKILDLFFWKEKYVPMPITGKFTTHPFANDRYIEIRSRVDKALQLLCKGLAPYIRNALLLPPNINMLNMHRRFITEHQNKYKDRNGNYILRKDIREWDAYLLLKALRANAINNYTLLYKSLGNFNIINKLIKYRNCWAHPNPFYRFTIEEKRYTCKSFNNMITLLTAVNATSQAEEIRDMLPAIESIPADDE